MLRFAGDAHLSRVVGVGRTSGSGPLAPSLGLQITTRPGAQSMPENRAVGGLYALSGLSRSTVRVALLERRCPNLGRRRRRGLKRFRDFSADLRTRTAIARAEPKNRREPRPRVYALRSPALRAESRNSLLRCSAFLPHHSGLAGFAPWAACPVPSGSHASSACRWPVLRVPGAGVPRRCSSVRSVRGPRRRAALRHAEESRGSGTASAQGHLSTTD